MKAALITLFLINTNLYARSLNIQTSEYGISMFCKDDAKSYMLDLEKISNTELKRIEVLKKEIDEIKARKTQSTDSSPLVGSKAEISSDDSRLEMCNRPGSSNKSICQIYKQNLASSAFPKEEIKFYEAKTTETLVDDDAEIKNRVNQITALISEHGVLVKNQKMADYIAKKFMRGCKGKSLSEITSPITSTCIESRDNLLNNIGTLNLNVSNIIGVLHDSSNITPNKSSTLFDKSELKALASYCKSDSENSIYVDICADINKELALIPIEKDPKEWEEFNKKYYVEYSPTSKSGYVYHEKKSNAAIFGQGLLQNVNTIFPIWMMNYQISNQIDFMTNQGMFIKQLNYMNDPTSPWMQNNYNFMQPTYYPGSAIPTNSGFSF